MLGTVLLQRHIDHSTYDFLVSEAELGESNILIYHPDRKQSNLLLERCQLEEKVHCLLNLFTDNMSPENSLKDLNLEFLDQNTYDSGRLHPPKIGPPKF